MIHFSFLLRSSLGIDARSIGRLVNNLCSFESRIHFYYKEKCADAKQIFQVIGLDIRSDDCVYVVICGKDAPAAYNTLRLRLSAIFLSEIELTPKLGGDRPRGNEEAPEAEQKCKKH